MTVGAKLKNYDANGFNSKQLHAINLTTKVESNIFRTLPKNNFKFMHHSTHFPSLHF